MISYTNITCMRLLWLGESGVSFWLWSTVLNGLVPRINRSAVQVLEKKDLPLLLPVTDIATEMIVGLTEIDTSTASNDNLEEKQINDYVRVWSVQHTLNVAQKLTDAIALLRAEKYIKISQHIETYIVYLSTFDPQYALVSLQQLRERLDKFGKQKNQDKLKSAITFYSPPTVEVYDWFRESSYRSAQSECIKALNVRSQVKTLSGNAWSMISAISKIVESNPTIQLEIDTAKECITWILESVSMETIYTKYFGKLDSNIVWLLYQWDILDAPLKPMLAQHFARKKQAPKISETLKELFYMNLIHRNRTPNIDLSK